MKKHGYIVTYQREKKGKICFRFVQGKNIRDVVTNMPFPLSEMWSFQIWKKQSVEELEKELEEDIKNENSNG